MKLETFDFNSAAVRVMVRDDAPWFVVADVCRVLEIVNPRDAIKTLDEDEKMTVANADGHLGQRGGAQSFNLVSESGLYALVFKSRKPVAKAFRRWVTGDVLPAIRKTGRYEEATAAVVPMPAGEVERMSLIGFVRARGAAWPLERKIQFGLLTRRYAKAMGLLAEVVQDPEMGAVLSFPVALLDEVGLQHGTRLAAGAPAADNVNVVEALASLLLEKQPEGGWISARELRALAVERGLWLKKDDVMALGRVLSPFAGRRLLDGWCWHSARTANDRGWRLELYAP